MADADLIARVYPCPDQDSYSLSVIEASSRRKPRKAPPLSTLEPTEPPERGLFHDTDYLPYLELRFSDIPRTASGLVFGTDPKTCDIVLPNHVRGISRRHFALTFDNNFDDGHYRLVVRDSSTYGTMVTYDGTALKLGTNRDSVISGHRVASDARKIIVRPHDDLRFRIVVAPHDITSAAYIANAKRFCRGLGA
jgi:hypothetical protein